MTSGHKIREMVQSEFESLVIGPRGGEKEFVSGRISLAYMAGILFPRGGRRSDLRDEGEDFSEDEHGSSSKSGEEFSGDQENPLSMANEELPSSVGISFLVSDDSFEVEVGAATYLADKNNNGEKGYQRVPFDLETVTSSELLSKGNVSVFGGRAKLSIIIRPSNFTGSGRIVTVSLLNSQEVNSDQKGKGSARSKPEKWLFQTSLKINCENGFLPYETTDVDYDDIEEQVLALQFTDSPVFAVGHGASVDWQISQQDIAPKSIRIAYLPSEYVYRPVFDRLLIDDVQSLELETLWDIRALAFTNDSHKESWFREAKEFIAFYERWIEVQAGLFSGNYHAAAQHLLDGMTEAAKRMASGIKFLESSEECWQAFSLANRAMLFQMEQVGRLKQLRREREQADQDWPIPYSERISSYDGDPEAFPSQLSPVWRPFQLAFFLLTVVGMENPESEDHQLVDLIWFSTGGGKTEAYLLLASYEMIRRRRRREADRVDPGTAVITRYTLRFLTADQLSRTASLVCALEKVRVHSHLDLGVTPFRVGLYIGVEQNSYSNFAKAESALNDLYADVNSPHKFQVTECPNCGTGLIPKASRDDGESLDAYGIEIDAGRIRYRCPNTACFFSSHRIPVTVIDQDIYDSPPDFLLGTVDKFAGLPFVEKSAAIFGAPKKGVKRSPPSLIIQDELHLISGPLGTLASIYEAAFDTLIKTYQDDMGLSPVGPKYVAASATVRDSDKQIRRLMGRDARIFPPRGMRAHDSFFAREDRRPETARLYVGLMPQGIRATTAAHWTSAALLQSVRQVAEEKLSSRENADFLWTLLCYCNSKRELGLINGAVSQEITERLKVYGERQNFDPDLHEQLKKQEVSSEAVKDVSSTRAGLLVGVIPRSDPDEMSETRRVVDFVPCTNMISVGVDIDRLGLMMVNGQPKTTSEYIQATSRVGRNPEGQGPGLVLALYSPAKPRDRSHYEYFKNYHSSLYRLVEPNSVTPGSARALERAAHAALVSVVRHGVSHMKGNNSVVNFDKSNAQTKRMIDKLVDRLLSAYEASDVYERGVIIQKLKDAADDWSGWISEGLTAYVPGGKNEPGLLKSPSQSATSRTGWLTMRSMRGVDVEIKGKIQ